MTLNKKAGKQVAEELGVEKQKQDFVDLLGILQDKDESNSLRNTLAHMLGAPNKLRPGVVSGEKNQIFASFPSIVEALTSPPTDANDLKAWRDLCQCMLVSYRRFFTPGKESLELLQLLEKRFNEATDDVIRWRVLNLVNLWISNYWEDFKQIRADLMRFLSVAAARHPNEVKACYASIKSIELKARRAIPPKRFKFSWESTPASELAMALHHMDCYSWLKIEPWECLDKAKLQVLHDNGTDLCDWATQEILAAPTIRACCFRVMKLIDTARNLRSMHNFNGSVLISTVFERHEISNLSLLWNLVLPVAYRATLEQLRESSSLEGRWKYLRYQKLAIDTFTTTPCVPFVPLFSNLCEQFGDTPYVDSQNRVSIFQFVVRGKTYHEVSRFRSSVKEMGAVAPTSMDFLSNFPKWNQKDLQFHYNRLNSKAEQISLAARDGDMEMVLLFLDSISRKEAVSFTDADVNAETHNTYPLHSAVKSNHPEVVELLLTHPDVNTRVDVVDSLGRNIISVATAFNAPNVLSLLLTSDKIPNSMKKRLETNNSQAGKEANTKQVDTVWKAFESDRSLSNSGYWISKRWFTKNRTKVVALRARNDTFLRVPLLTDDILSITKNPVSALEELLSSEQAYLSSLVWLFWKVLNVSLQYFIVNENMEPETRGYYFKAHDSLMHIIELHVDIVTSLLRNRNAQGVIAAFESSSMGDLKIWYKRYLENVYPDGTEGVTSPIVKLFSSQFANLRSLLNERPGSGQSLGDYFILPIQRMPRIKFLLETAVKQAPGLRDVCKSVKNLCDALNTANPIQQSRKELKKLGKTYSCIDPKFCVAPGRRFILAEAVQIDSKNGKLVLCSDAVLLIRDDFIGSKLLNKEATSLSTTMLSERGATDLEIDFNGHKMTVVIQNAQIRKKIVDGFKAAKEVLQSTLNMLHEQTTIDPTLFVTNGVLLDLKRWWSQTKTRRPIDDYVDKHGNSLLYVACSYGHEDIVIWLIREGANVNLQQGKGSTPLHVAAWRGHNRVCQALLNSGANADLKNKFNQTALDEALERNFEDVVELLAGYTTQESPSVNPASRVNTPSAPVTDAPVQTNLPSKPPAVMITDVCEACKTGNIEILHRWKAQCMISTKGKLPINTVLDDDKNSLLYLACDSSQKISVIKWLLSEGASVNYKHPIHGGTPLHVAAWAGDQVVCKELMEAGANPMLRNNNNEPPSECAAMQGFTDLSMFLAQWETSQRADRPLPVSPSSPQLYSVPALFQACKEGNLTFLQSWEKRLSANQAKIENEVNLIVDSEHNNNSLLYTAASFGNSNVVIWLLDRGAWINRKQDQGSTPLHAAAWRQKIDVCKILLSRGANPTLTNIYEETPASNARAAGRPDIEKLLAEFTKPTQEEVIPPRAAPPPQEESKPPRVALPPPPPPLIDPFAECDKDNPEGLAQWRLQNPHVDINTLYHPNFHTNLLYCAARNGKMRVVAWLLNQKGINIDQRQELAEHKSTALHTAAFQGHTEICRLLLEHGARLDIKNNYGELPTDNAHSDLLKVLDWTQRPATPNKRQ